MANPVTYQKRRAQGLCGSCGEVETGEKARCDECKAKELDKKRERYEARKAAGRCPQCDEPVDGTVLCATCRNKQTGAKARYHANKDSGTCRACGADSGGKAYCPEHAARQKEYQAKSYEQRKRDQRCSSCGKSHTASTTRCAKCTARDGETQKARNIRLRAEVFAAYGGPVCAGCGFDTEAVLEMDHIDGGGNQHRKQIGNGRLYIWLQQHDYPPGYRVLCPTCNKLAHKGVPLPNEQ